MLEDVEWRFNSIKEAVDSYNEKETRLTRENIEKYSDYMEQLDEIIDDVNDFKQLAEKYKRIFTDWLGGKLREHLSGATNIWISYYGNEIVLSSNTFNNDVLEFLRKHELEVRNISTVNGNVRIYVELFKWTKLQKD